MTSLCDSLEACWPLGGMIRRETWVQLQGKMEACLLENGILNASFGHYGIVVSNIDRSLDVLFERMSERPGMMRRDWVESYHVHVARFEIEGTEVEFLEPGGDSFFDDALHNLGEGLQHMAFEVDDIEMGLQGLANNRVELVDREPRRGSHGKIAFARPRAFEPIYLEVYQPIRDGNPGHSPQ